MSTTYMRRITPKAADQNSFPQADSLPRLLDVLALAAYQPKVDESVIAEQFGLSARQGAYYFSAAAYVGLVYKRGGWIKPTPDGARINAMSDHVEQRSAVFDMVVQLAVFSQAARHLSGFGELPPLEEVSQWVRDEDQKVNDTTASRRANTVLSWIEMVHAECPQTIDCLSAPPLSRMA
jgi:hypothetical protein